MPMCSLSAAPLPSIPATSFLGRSCPNPASPSLCLCVQKKHREGAPGYHGGYVSPVRGLLTEDLSPDPCFLSIATCLSVALFLSTARGREPGSKDSKGKKKSLHQKNLLPEVEENSGKHLHLVLRKQKNALLLLGGKGEMLAGRRTGGQARGPLCL